MSAKKPIPPDNAPIPPERLEGKLPESDQQGIPETDLEAETERQAEKQPKATAKWTPPPFEGTRPTHHPNGAPFRPGDERDPETDLPMWVLEAERMYLSKKLTTQRAVSAHFDRPFGTVNAWSKRRNWASRRKHIEELAGKKLAEKIDADASQDAVDTFAALDQNTIAAGLRASHYINGWADQALKEQRAAAMRGETYSPPSLPNQMIQLVEMAQRLRPKERENSTFIESLGDLLNPRED